MITYHLGIATGPKNAHHNAANSPVIVHNAHRLPPGLPRDGRNLGMPSLAPGGLQQQHAVWAEQAGLARSHTAETSTQSEWL